MAGLIQFLKGSRNPDDRMPGCVNYDHHYGGCLLKDTCDIEQGKRCGYFEKAVLPTSFESRKAMNIAEEYKKQFCSGNIAIEQPTAKIRFCECGEVLKLRQRFCNKCSLERRRESARQRIKRFRTVQCNALTQNRAL